MVRGNDTNRSVGYGSYIVTHNTKIKTETALGHHVIIKLGCNGGSGVVLMPWLGRAVGRRIAGTDDPTQPMSSLAGIPYERQPLGEHTSKLVAAAGVWYGLRDRIDAVRP